MTVREVVVNIGTLFGYPFSCYPWIFTSYRNKLGRGWYFFGISIGGFSSWAMLIGSLFTDNFVHILLCLGGIALYIAMMFAFILFAEQCQKDINRIEAEGFPRRRSPEMA